MYSAFDRTQRAFLAVLAATIVLAFAPSGLLRWTNDLAEIVRVPTRPFTHLGVRLGNWFRPPQTAALDVPEEARALVEHLQGEVDRYKQLYTAEQIEVQSLRRTLEQLQRVPAEARRPVRLLTASITARSPAGRFAPVQLNRGTTHGVKAGAIALYNGVYLVGRVTDVTAIGSTMLPLVNRSTGVLQANVTASEDGTYDEQRNILLEAEGDGTFTAAVDEQLPIQVGDEAMLADPEWPDAAMGTTIGQVTSIEDIEEMPLRKRIVVTPRFYVHELADVTLKIELDETELAGVADGGAP